MDNIVVPCFFDSQCKWKDAISGFRVSPDSAEALVRWDGKIKYILIAYLQGNICAKNCRNWTEYVKIIASQRDVFWDTVYSHMSANPENLVKIALVSSETSLL